MRANTHSVFIGIVIVAAAAQCAFIYGYTRAFPRIEATNPKKFEQNAAAALSRGDVRAAKAISRFAIGARPLDPMTYTVYARALLAAGEDAEAIRQLIKAVGLTHERVQSQPQPTRKPYFFAPARLALGEYYWNANRPLDALFHFELAHDRTPPENSPFDAYSNPLYGVYARYGLWSHALRFGQPAEDDLQNLAEQDLVALAIGPAETTNWTLAQTVADHLSARGGTHPEADYLRGRIALDQERYADAILHFHAAADAGHEISSFFAGVAHERNGETDEAILAYDRVPSGNVYSVFALAKSLSLQSSLPDSENYKLLLKRLDRELDQIRSQPKPVPFDQFLRFTPIAVRIPEHSAESDAAFPILVLWEDGKSSPSDGKPSAMAGAPDGPVLLLRYGKLVLQLQWVNNLVNWAIVEKLPAGRGPIPGWTDTAREWFAMEPDFATTIQADNSKHTSLRIDQTTWYYSVPVHTHDDAGYLLFGRVRSEQGNGGLAWQAMGDDERVISEMSVNTRSNLHEWDNQLVYIKSRVFWKELRVQLNVLPFTGPVSFDDIILVEISEPDQTL